MSENQKTAGERVKDVGNTPAPVHIAGCTADERGNRQQHLQIFDYVGTPEGNGVVIRNGLHKMGVILDVTQELVYFERPGDIEKIQPVRFVVVPPPPGEQRDAPCQEDEYRYLDPHGWPYNDPNMTDVYLIACGFPTRESIGYPFPTKPAHVERLRRAMSVLTPKGKGKLWRNWDTQVGVILEGTQHVTFFHTLQEWEQIVPLDEDPSGAEETDS